MKNKVLMILSFILIIVIETSCIFWRDNNRKVEKTEEKKEPVFNVNELWRISLEDSPNVKTVIEDSFFYVVKGDLLYTTEERKFKVLKININNPSEIIESKEFTGIEASDFLIVGNMLIIGTREFKVLILNKNDLSLIKEQTIRHLMDGPVYEYKGNLYWENGANGYRGENRELILEKDNVVKANLEDIINCTSEIYEVEYVCHEFNGESIISMRLEEGILYFLTYNRDYWKEDGGLSYFVAWDLDSNQKLWAHELKYEFFRSEADIQIVGDKIYLISVGRYCFDKKTGKELWRIIQTDEDKTREVIIHTDTCLKDMLYYDGKFYFTNGEYFGSKGYGKYPKENYKNIICINAEDGSYVWGDIFMFQISNAIGPCEYNDKIYFPTDAGLRVYEAQTGKLIGVNEDYKGTGYKFIYKYNDILLMHINKRDHVDLVAMKAE